jgi:hypothetical protein
MSVVDRETANNEFERWAEAMRVDLDTEGLDENDARDLAKDRSVFVKAVMQGRLVVSEEGLAVFTPEGGDPITFHKPKGNAFTAMDKAKRTQDIGKIFKSMAAITRTAPVTFDKMDVADVKICMTILTLFLA